MFYKPQMNVSSASAHQEGAGQVDHSLPTHPVLSFQTFRSHLDSVGRNRFNIFHECWLNFWNRLVPIHKRNILGTGINFRWFNSLQFPLRRSDFYFLLSSFSQQTLCLVRKLETRVEVCMPGGRCARPQMEVWMPISAPGALVAHERACVFLFVLSCL